MCSIQNQIPIDINADNCLARVWTNDGLGAQCSSTRLPDNHDLDHNYYCEYHRKLFDIAGHNYPCHFNSSGQQEGIFYGHVTEPYPIFSPNGRLAINWKVREVQDRIDKAILEGKHWHNWSEVKKAERAKLAKEKNDARKLIDNNREKAILAREQALADKEKELDEYIRIAKEKAISDNKELAKKEKALDEREASLVEKEKDIREKELEHINTFNSELANIERTFQAYEYTIDNIDYLVDIKNKILYDLDVNQVGKLVNNTLYIYKKPDVPIDYKVETMLDQFIYENKVYYKNKDTNILYNKDFEIIGRVSGDKLIVVNKDNGIKKTLHVTEIVHEGKRYLKQVDGKEIYDLEGNEIGYSLAGGQIIAMIKP